MLSLSLLLSYTHTRSPPVSTKMMHSVSFELSFIWDKMRTAAQETAPQIALRDCSKETVGEGQYIWFWRRGSSMQLSTHFINGFLLVTTSWCHHGADVIMIYSFSRYEKMQRLGSRNQFLRISNYLKTCSTRFPGAECLTAPWTASAGTEGHQEHRVPSPQRQRQMLLLCLAVVQSLAMLLASANL